ncbi:MAG: DinB family protein [Flavobacteriales bacterium]|nr:DinB family protein [Flavobacteriales bacterium]
MLRVLRIIAEQVAEHDMDSLQLISDLRSTLEEQIARAQQIRALPAAQLLHRPAPEQWNTLEVFEHMNLSSGIYLRNLREVFDRKAVKLKFNAVFTPGRLGAYSVKSMTPRADGTIPLRMKTLGKFEPRKLDGASSGSIDRFVTMCEGFLALLERSEHTDLNAMKVASSLGPIVRFRAGDAFRFPVAHQVRHFHQIERVLRSAR